MTYRRLFVRVAFNVRRLARRFHWRLGSGFRWRVVCRASESVAARYGGGWGKW